MGVGEGAGVGEGVGVGALGVWLWVGAAVRRWLCVGVHPYYAQNKKILLSGTFDTQPQNMQKT